MHAICQYIKKNTKGLRATISPGNHDFLDFWGKGDRACMKRSPPKKLLPMVQINTHTTVTKRYHMKLEATVPKGALKKKVHCAILQYASASLESKEMFLTW